MAKKTTNKSNIKSSFELEIFHTKWKICFVDKIPCEETRFTWGDADYLDNVIHIATKDPHGNPIDEKDILKTFFHEAIHAISAQGCYLDVITEPITEFFAVELVSILQQLHSNIKI